MEEKTASISIIVSDYDSVDKINALLHEYRNYVLGRLGVPIKEKGISVISVVLSAPQDVLNALSGKLGMIKGVKSKALY